MTPSVGQTPPIRPDFNSHARVGRDAGRKTMASLENDFNSHARVGRDRTHGGARPGTAHFNSHARVGRDGAALQLQDQKIISTHTPV